MKWMLPDGVEEWLPPDAWQLETLRRQVLDCFAVHGFELILPPMLEYADSLNIGVGQDLMLQTFALTDQLSGRRLGLRADITPQAARIDAHRLGDSEGVRRLCYLGTVLRTRAELPAGPRSLRQLGAEIFGAADLAADVEVITVMQAILNQAGWRGYTLDLGHAGILRSLLPDTLGADDRNSLLALIQRKAADQVASHAEALGLAREVVANLRDVCHWHGAPDAVPEPGAHFPEAARAAYAELLAFSRRLQARFPRQALHLDCGELTGYRYQTGVSWSVYAPGEGQALARGGRYDGIGSAFGKARPATGFSADLNTLLRAGQALLNDAQTVCAPPGEDAHIQRAVAQARAAGHRVYQAMPGEDTRGRQLTITPSGEWTIEETDS